MVEDNSNFAIQNCNCLIVWMHGQKFHRMQYSHSSAQIFVFLRLQSNVSAMKTYLCCLDVFCKTVLQNIGEKLFVLRAICFLICKAIYSCCALKRMVRPLVTKCCNVVTTCFKWCCFKLQLSRELSMHHINVPLSSFQSTRVMKGIVDFFWCAAPLGLSMGCYWNVECVLERNKACDTSQGYAIEYYTILKMKIISIKAQAEKFHSMC